jgi:hypothetical protein
MASTLLRLGKEEEFELQKKQAPIWTAEIFCFEDFVISACTRREWGFYSFEVFSRTAFSALLEGTDLGVFSYGCCSSGFSVFKRGLTNVWVWEEYLDLSSSQKNLYDYWRRSRVGVKEGRIL